MTAGPARHIEVTIACGGTGGHLFPGLAVARRLTDAGCTVTALVSPKEVDQTAIRSASGFKFVTLPAVGLQRGRLLAFAAGFVKSYTAAHTLFRGAPPRACLGMGGFTSAPPLLAAKRMGARTFLHESNTIPGRANRWLSRVVDSAFVGFPSARSRLHCAHVTVTGTPVRPEFRAQTPAVCRRELALDPVAPTLLVTGGSQGAGGLNSLLLASLPILMQGVPGLQVIHLAGVSEAQRVQQAYAAFSVRAVVEAFSDRMDLCLGAADVVISRAGASSLAEIAATRVPCALVPFPAATDNHQFHNARSLAETGAAILLEQKSTSPERLGHEAARLFNDRHARASMQGALAKWDSPGAAEQIADAMLRSVLNPEDYRAKGKAPATDLQRSLTGTQRPPVDRKECQTALSGGAAYQA